jgi:mannosyltransferase
MMGAARDEARFHRAAMIAIVLLATVLRVAYLDRPSLFYDEIIVLDMASQPGPAALVRLLEETDATRAPLHPLILQGWVALFGASSPSGRAFSVACGVLAVLLVERIGRRAYDAPTGLWAAFLFAISPMQVRYAQEVRMYALLVLETCLAWDLLLSFRDSAPPARQAAFLGCLIALGYTHPLGLLMVAALGLAYLADLGRSRLSWRRWLAIQVAAALAIAPWAIRYGDHPPEFTVGRLPLKYLVALPIGYIGGNGLTLLGFLALVAFGIVRRGGETGRRLVLDRPAETTTILTWFVVPPLLLFGHSLVSSYPIFGPPRYTLNVGPAYLILVARGLVKLPRLPRYAVASACVLLAGSLLRTLVYAPDVKTDWRDAAAHIRRVDPRAAVVLLTDDATNQRQLVPLRHYLGPRTNLLLMPRAVAELARDPEALGEFAWTVADEVDGRPKATPPPDWLRRYDPVRSTKEYPGVELTYYRRRPEG